MKMRMLAGALLVLSLLVDFTGATDYPGGLKKKVKQALGRDFAKYEWFSYPTDNFGVATAFFVKTPTEQPGPQNQICATFTCLGRSKPTDLDSFLSVNGYADVGTGGPISLTEKEKSELSLGGVLPQLLKAAGVTTKISNNSVTSTALTLGPAHQRVLKQGAWTNYVKGLPKEEPLRKAFENQQLALVVSDVVIESMDFDIQVSKSLASEIQAKLGEKEIPVIGVSSDFQVKVIRAGETQYHFIVNRPVIVCRLIAKEPVIDMGPTGDFAKTNANTGFSLTKLKFRKYLSSPELKAWAYWKPLRSRE